MDLMSVRSNTRFIMNYESKQLIPAIELILLVGKPKYKTNKKRDGISKDQEILEIRFETTLTGINALIGELQATLAGLNTFEQLAGSINAIIKASKTEDKI